MPCAQRHEGARFQSLLGASVCIAALLMQQHLWAQALPGHGHESAESLPEHGLHFTHPLFAESVTPDTKLRLDYALEHHQGANASEVEVEGEYAFASAFSIEAGSHYDLNGGRLGDTHVIFKFAHQPFAARRVSVGYGMELGLPTGTPEATGGAGDAGSAGDVYELTPFVNGGWQSAAWELVGWGLVEFPAGASVPEDRGTRLRYQLSALRHVSTRLDLLVEGFGSRALGNGVDEAAALELAPGIRFLPAAAGPLALAAAVALPVSAQREYDSRLRFSGFWHF